ncbi:MAG: hypothetical protein CMJ30_04735 [Phycisphaerae bacterium]|nr:hypothetical protein [Phycisphaerae bacterium]
MVGANTIGNPVSTVTAGEQKCNQAAWAWNHVWRIQALLWTSWERFGQVGHLICRKINGPKVVGPPKLVGDQQERRLASWIFTFSTASRRGQRRRRHRFARGEWPFLLGPPGGREVKDILIGM